MRFAVEAWATEYGASVEEVLATPQQPADLTVEVPVSEWAPRWPAPGTEPAEVVLFTDGVRRIEGRVWIDVPGSAAGSGAQQSGGAAGAKDPADLTDPTDLPDLTDPTDLTGAAAAAGVAGARLGVCASYAAGIVRAERHESGGEARVVATEVRRGLFTAVPNAEAIRTRHATFGVRAACCDGPEQLSLAVQQRMGELEIELSAQAGAADLVVVDGPLRGRQHVANAIGYVKTHHVAYLPPVVQGVVAALGPGQRTPLFLTSTSWTRYSWYLRLPGRAGHAWAGVVRCEASADLAPFEAVVLADRAALTLPRFASAAHKDPRAPQNLYPIAGLERTLRHRLGDPALLYRSLCVAAGER